MDVRYCRCVVVTIAVAVLTSVVAAVITLPAFFQRCPYKSPTGWACVIIVRSLIWAIQYVWWLTARWWYSILSSVGPRDRVESLAALLYFELYQFQSWRERYLLHDGLDSTEILDLADVGVSGEDSQLHRMGTTQPVQNICEVIPLLRALSWVRKCSEDSQLLRQVTKSVKSLHRDQIGWAGRYYTFLYAMRRLSSDNSGQLQTLSAAVERIRYKAYKTVRAQHGDAYIIMPCSHRPELKTYLLPPTPFYIKSECS